MKVFTKEVKIALVAIMGVIILFFGMNFLKGLTLFSNDTGYPPPPPFRKMVVVGAG